MVIVTFYLTIQTVNSDIFHITIVAIEKQRLELCTLQNAVLF